MIFIALLLATTLVGFVALMALAARSGTKEYDHPDEALDNAFTGGDVATWQLTIGGLGQRQVVEGAAQRGYRLTAPAGSNGVLTFERR